MSQTLTQTYVDGLKPAEKLYIRWDDKIAGFGVRVSPSGRKTFFYQYRKKPAGRHSPTKRITIGANGTNIKCHAARKRAEEYQAQVSQKLDPQQEQKAEKEAITVEQLIERYLSKHAMPKKRSAADDKRRLERFLLAKNTKGEKVPGFTNYGKAKARDIDRDDIEAIFEAIPSKYEANRFLANARKMFSLAIRWKVRPDNPCKDIDMHPEYQRERYLTEKELLALWKALASYSNQQSANAVRLLALTGARTSEVLRATWDQFDLEAAIWTKPSSHTKIDRTHRVNLSQPAVDLLKSITRMARSKYVFPGELLTKSERTREEHYEPLKSIRRCFRECAATAKIKDVRPHDLRHSYASLLVSTGHTLELIGALLGHTQVATTKRYAHLLDNPQRDATNLVGNILTGATSA